MNYANMIEEKNLKKGFIVATLISTVIGTFTASMALVDKIQDRRDKMKQKATDGKQDTEIQELRGKLEKLEATDQAKSDESKGVECLSRSTRSRRRPRQGDPDDSERYEYAARKSRAIIEQTFADHVNRLGEKYARGDLITRNRLQAQVIQLQQTVIDILQNTLQSGQNLHPADLNQLLKAQKNARHRSIEALEGQYRRMITSRASQTVAPIAFSTPHAASSSPPSTRRHKALLQPPREIFCRYSRRLQDSSVPLHPAFNSSGSQRCPACNMIVLVDMRDVRAISTRNLSDRYNNHKTWDYRMNVRFIVKSHNSTGGFGCVLCSKHRDMDCICKSVNALAKHLGSKHTPDELAGETDLVRMRNESRTRKTNRELVFGR